MPKTIALSPTCSLGIYRKRKMIIQDTRPWPWGAAHPRPEPSVVGSDLMTFNAPVLACKLWQETVSRGSGIRFYTPGCCALSRMSNQRLAIVCFRNPDKFLPSGCGWRRHILFCQRGEVARGRGNALPSAIFWSVKIVLMIV